VREDLDLFNSRAVPNKDEVLKNLAPDALYLAAAKENIGHANAVIQKQLEEKGNITVDCYVQHCPKAASSVEERGRLIARSTRIRAAANEYDPEDTDAPAQDTCDRADDHQVEVVVPFLTQEAHDRYRLLKCGPNDKIKLTPYLRIMSIGGRVMLTCKAAPKLSLFNGACGSIAAFLYNMDKPVYRAEPTAAAAANSNAQVPVVLVRLDKCSVPVRTDTRPSKRGFRMRASVQAH
jgi:hypothetical protein